MSDARYDTYQHYGTNAERLAFVPNPPSLTGVQPIYIWYETDTGDTYAYYTAWTLLASSGGGGNVNATYLTENDETATLPNSRQELAGTNVTFDDTVPGVRTINVAGSGGINKTVVDIVHADILTLPTTPVSLIPAPGANNIVRVLNASLIIKASAGAYTNIDPDYATMQIETADGNWWQNIIVNDSTMDMPSTRLTDFFSAADRYVPLALYLENLEYGVVSGNWGWMMPGVDAQLSNFVNKAVQLSIDNNGAGDLTGGNAANTLRVILYHSTEATT